MDENEQYIKELVENQINNLQNKGIYEELTYLVKILRNGIGTRAIRFKTIQGYINILCQLYHFRNKNSFLEYNKEDLIDYFDHCENNNLKKSSINMYKIKIKKYFTLIYRDKKLCKFDEVPEIVSWINVSYTIAKTKSIEDVFVPSEIQKMINTADNLRDKCLLSIGFEGAFRISELLGIKLKDINLNENHAFVIVSGKTGTRKNILIDSYPYLINWLENHPYKNNKESYLFIALDNNYYGNKLYPSSVNNKLKTLVKRLGLKKRKVSAHTIFRHSRLTYLASTLNWNEPKLRTFAGWSSDSTMANIYCHGTEKDVYNSLMIEAGIFKEEDSNKNEKEKNIMKPKICPKCSKRNPSGSLYCNCGFCLDYEEAKTIEAKKSKAIDEATKILMDIMSDPKRLEQFMKFKESQS